MLYKFIRNGLFHIPSETAHYVTLDALSAAGRLKITPLLIPQVKAPLELMGLRFSNAVGLAAGMDKNGDYIDALAALGFGFLEIGTVTPRPQPGNPKPRLFRIPAKQAIINRMGFNNKGVDYLVRQVQKCRYTGVLGINIGKNADTPVENAIDDYLICMKKVYSLASYVVINISSPNTPGLRNLQYGESLDQLLSRLKDEQGKLAGQYGKTVPLVVKIAPDLEGDEVEAIAEQLVSNEIEGVIATNTTITRAGVENFDIASEAGGLSGAPLFNRSTETLRKLGMALKGKVPIIGVGGIVEPDDAVMKVESGASLVQIYSGLVFSGPGLISDSAKKLAGIT